MKSLILLAFLLLPFSSFADTFFVEEVKGTEVSNQDKVTIRELIRMSVPQVDRHTVADKAGEADYTLSAKVLKLGDAFIMNLEKKSTKGEATFSEKMKAVSMSDMDKTSQRLVTAVIKEERVKDTADVTNITDEEKKQNINRIEATRQWMIGLGPSWTENLNSQGSGGFTFLLGFEWGLDPDYSVDLSWLAHSGRREDESSFNDFSVGGTYYFSRTRFAPFASVRLGYATVDINAACPSGTWVCPESDESGWSGSAVVGYKFFRTSAVNVSTMLRYTSLFASGPLGNPSMTSFLIVVHY